MLLPRSCLLLVVLVPGLSVGEHEATRLMYDTMAQLVGDPAYPDTWYNVLTSAQCPQCPHAGGRSGRSASAGSPPASSTPWTSPGRLCPLIGQQWRFWSGFTAQLLFIFAIQLLHAYCI